MNTSSILLLAPLFFTPLWASNTSSSLSNSTSKSCIEPKSIPPNTCSLLSSTNTSNANIPLSTFQTNILPTAMPPLEKDSSEEIEDIPKKKHKPTHRATPRPNSSNFPMQLNSIFPFSLPFIQPIFTCPLCQETNLFKNELELHLQAHIYKQPYLSSYLAQKYTQNINVTHPTPNRKREKTFEDYMPRKRVKKNTMVSIQSQNQKFVPLQEGMYLHTFFEEKKKGKGKTRRYACSICHKAFNTRKEVDEHSFDHQEGKPFQCIYCFMFFHETKEVKIHISEFHKIKGFFQYREHPVIKEETRDNC